MNRARLYQFLFEKLTARGIAVISVRDIGTLAEIEKALDVLKDDSTSSLASAALAILLPDVEPDDVEAEFGNDAAEIFGELRGKTHISVGDRLIAQGNAAQLISKSQNPHAAAAAAAFLAAEVTSTTEQERVGLLELLKLVLQHVAGGLKDFVTALVAKLEAPRQEKKEVSSQPFWLISLSIDVVASTEAKTRMRALAADDGQLENLHSRFYRDFLFREDRFYRHLFAPAGFGSRPVDWRRLFVVKGIGDEIWLFYEIPRDNVEILRSAMARFFEAAIALVGETVHWSGSERDPGPGFDPEKEMQERADGMRLPFKVYIDLIKDGYEISKVRAEQLLKSVNFYLNLPDNSRFSQDQMQIASRLNGGYFELAGRMFRQVYRTDYIGHEVDRFFRTTKAALPATVTIGESLFQNLAVKSRPVAYPGLFRAELTYKPDVNSNMFTTHSNILYMKGVLTPDGMKGIGYPYTSYHCLTIEQLRMLHFGNFADKKVLAPTLEIFSRDLLTGMQTLEERARHEAHE